MTGTNSFAGWLRAVQDRQPTFTGWLDKLKEREVGRRTVNRTLVSMGFHHCWGYYIHGRSGVKVSIETSAKKNRVTKRRDIKLSVQVPRADTYFRSYPVKTVVQVHELIKSKIGQ